MEIVRICRERFLSVVQARNSLDEEILLFQLRQREHVIVAIQEQFAYARYVLQEHLYATAIERRQVLLRDKLMMVNYAYTLLVHPVLLLALAREYYIYGTHKWHERPDAAYEQFLRIPTAIAHELNKIVPVVDMVHFLEILLP